MATTGRAVSLRTTIAVSLGKTQAQITAQFAPVPGIAPVGEAICAIIQLAQDMTQNRHAVNQLRDRCHHLGQALYYKEVSESANKNPSANANVAAVNAVTECLVCIQTRMKDWASLSTVKAFIHQAEITQNIEHCHVLLTGSFTSLQLTSHLENHDWQTQFKVDNEQDQQELIEYLTNIQNSQAIVNEALQPQDNHELMSMMQHLLGKNKKAANSVHNGLSSNLYDLQLKSKKLLPDFNLCHGEVVRIGQFPISGTSAMDIYEGLYLQREKVSIKAIRVLHSSEQSLRRFNRELEIWKDLWKIDQGKYILPFYGFCTEDGPFPYMVSPWMQNGTALAYVKQKDTTIDYLNLVREVALGLQVLHTMTPPVVHGDIKANNIIIGPLGNPLIADFGLSRIVEDLTGVEFSQSRGASESYRWFAPEVCIGQGVLSLSSDIYAYGMTVLELFTHQQPYHEIKHTTEVVIRAAKGERPPRPIFLRVLERGLNDALWELLQRCWVYQPSERPTIQNIIKDLPEHSAALLAEEHDINNRVPALSLEREAVPEDFVSIGTEPEKPSPEAVGGAVLTFMIYTPDDIPPLDASSTLREEEWEALQTAGLGHGGSIFFHYAPTTAIAWVESHYDDTLLINMRSYGLGGPIAVMLSHDQPALAVFGPMLDDWVQEAAQLLSNLSRFAVMVWPLEDDPVHKWASFPPLSPDENDGGEPKNFAGRESKHNTGVHRDDNHDSESGDDGSSTSDDDDANESVDNLDDKSIIENPGAKRLRGGANGSQTFAPWIGPVHDADVNLDIRPMAHITYNVGIQSKIRFTIQSKYEDESRNGYRPQVVSWTRFSVTSSRLEVLPDRSYSSVGFVAHGQYISNAKPIDCGFSEPDHITAVTETESKQNMWSANITGAVAPSGSLGFSGSRSSTSAIQFLNDRVAPKWVVQYDQGGSWKKDGDHYKSLNISYQATNDSVHLKKGVNHPLEVEFSMGINVLNQENPNDSELPQISFVSRNQTMLWIANAQLKAKCYGVIALTCAYIPDVKTPDHLAIVEDQTIDIAQIMPTNIPVPDTTPASYSAALSLLIGKMELTGKEEKHPFKQLWNRLASEPATQRLEHVPLYEITARGWDATLDKWRAPVYPALDVHFRSIKEGSAPSRNLIIAPGVQTPPQNPQPVKPIAGQGQAQPGALPAIKPAPIP